MDISKLHLNFNSFQGKGFYEYKNHNNLNVVKGNSNIEELNNLNDVKLKYKEIIRFVRSIRAPKSFE